MSSAKSPESFISTFYEMVNTTVLPLTLAGPTLLFTGKVKKNNNKLRYFFRFATFPYHSYSYNGGAKTKPPITLLLHAYTALIRHLVQRPACLLSVRETKSDPSAYFPLKTMKA